MGHRVVDVGRREHHDRHQRSQVPHDGRPTDPRRQQVALPQSTADGRLCEERHDDVHHEQRIQAHSRARQLKRLGHDTDDPSEQVPGRPGTCQHTSGTQVRVVCEQHEADGGQRHGGQDKAALPHVVAGTRRQAAAGAIAKPEHHDPDDVRHHAQQQQQPGGALDTSRGLVVHDESPRVPPATSPGPRWSAYDELTGHVRCVAGRSRSRRRRRRPERPPFWVVPGGMLTSTPRSSTVSVRGGVVIGDRDCDSPASVVTLLLSKPTSVVVSWMSPGCAMTLSTRPADTGDTTITVTKTKTAADGHSHGGS